MQQIRMPKQASNIIEKLQAAGHEAYVVGGCVRDSLLGREPYDWDITTSATPMQVKEVFPRTIDTGIKHGTVTVMMDHVGYEITTYRIDGEYEDGRHPKNVTFTPSLKEDLRRRDFTINAMAYNDRDGLVDLFDGVGDLERGIVKAVGEARQRFSEDALRMMRAVRFCAQLGYSLDEETAQAIKELAPTLKRISAERIRVELIKLLTSPHPEQMRLFYELSLTKEFLPEFDRAMETGQNNPHHCYSVGEHIIKSICEIRNAPTLRLAMLFHDLGKPVCKTTDEKGIDHFYGHPAISAKIAKKRMGLLKFDNETRDTVVFLAQYHDLRIEPEEKKVRKKMSEFGTERTLLLTEVETADVKAQSDYKREEKLERIRLVKEWIERIRESGDPLTVKDLTVDGTDLIRLGYPKGPALGLELKALLELCLQEPEKNQRDGLLALAEKHLEQMK